MQSKALDSIQPDALQLPLNTNFAFATRSIHNESCAQWLVNYHLHIHVLIEVTKECVDVVNKMNSTTVVVPCRLSSFKHLIAVNYNSSFNNTTDIGGAPLRRR